MLELSRNRTSSLAFGTRAPSRADKWRETYATTVAVNRERIRARKTETLMAQKLLNAFVPRLVEKDKQ
jgi:hypothetical protein